MRLFYNNTQKYITADDSSYMYQSIMGDCQVSLKFSLAEYVKFPIGTRIELFGENFSMQRPFAITKIHNSNYEYSMILEGDQSKLKSLKLRNIADKSLKFSMTAKPRTHLAQIVTNLNRRDEGWSIGVCISGAEKTISYNHVYLLDALNTLASEYNTEWEIKDKTIHLRKVEHNKNNPLPLSYGKGNGFLSGVSRTNNEDKKPLTALYVQGGSRNIDFSQYGHKELRLPSNQTIIRDGITYISDDLGLSVKRQNAQFEYAQEDSLDLSHIYPKREGTVSDLEIESVADNFYNFIDDTIPEELDFNNYLTTEQTTVIFQSGILCGKEFNVKYIHAERKFILEPTEIDGMTMPNEVFKPQIGDKYIIFNISMPNSYIEEASEEMLREAVVYLHENQKLKFSFEGELDPIYIKKNWENIGHRLSIGNFVSFTDNQFQQEPILVRIKGIKRYLNNPYSPKIELSNTVSRISVSSELKKIKSQEIIVSENLKKAKAYTKRTFNQSKELITVIAKDFKNFNKGINPATVETMMMLIGDKSLQFRFVESEHNPQEIVLQVDFDKNTKKLHVTSGTLQHQRIGVGENDKYRYWNIPQFISGELYKTDQIYRLYAKAEKEDSRGEFLLSEDKIQQNEQSEYYHFLVGYVSAEDYGMRSFKPVFGFTEILPGQIVTGKIAPPNGSNYIELTEDRINISANKFTIQSNGTSYRIPTEKGEWIQGTYNYYDRVSHNGSLWLCIADSGTTDEPSDNCPFWKKQTQKGGDKVNFVKNGMFNEGYNHWKKQNYLGNIEIVNSPLGKFNSAVLMSEQPCFLWQIFELKQGNYFLSCLCVAETNNGSDVQITINRRQEQSINTVSLQDCNVHSTDSWQNIEFSFDIDHIGNYDVLFRKQEGAQIYITNIKIVKLTEIEDLLNKNVVEHSSKISVLDKEISSKVTAEEFNAVGEVVAKNSSEISVLDKEISSKVTAEEFNAVGEVVAKNSSEIKQTAKEIALKVSNSDLKATGIDIEQKQIRLTALNTKIQTENGEEIAMFTVINGKPMLLAVNIQFEGMSTKNNLFKINENGSFEATAGKIGDYEIKNTYLEAGNLGNGRVTLDNNFIVFKKENDEEDIFAGFGENVLNTAGTIGHLRVKNRSTTTKRVIGLFLNIRPQKPHGGSGRKSYAMYSSGNIRSVGGHTFRDDTYIGQAYNNVIIENIDITHQFTFTDVTEENNEYLEIRLPDAYQAGGYGVTFVLNVTMAISTGHKKIRLLGDKYSQIINNDGYPHHGGYGYINMERGDVVMLRYYAGCYYIMLVSY